MRRFRRYLGEMGVGQTKYSTISHFELPLVTLNLVIKFTMFVPSVTGFFLVQLEVW